MRCLLAATMVVAATVPGCGGGSSSPASIIGGGGPLTSTPALSTAQQSGLSAAAWKAAFLRVKPKMTMRHVDRLLGRPPAIRSGRALGTCWFYEHNASNFAGGVVCFHARRVYFVATPALAKALFWSSDGPIGGQGRSRVIRVETGSG